MTNQVIDIPSGWEIASLDDISSKITDGSHNPPKKQENGIPMLSAVNIKDGSISFEKVRYVTESDFEREYARANIEQDDVLLTIVGSIGRTAVVSKKHPTFAIQRSVALIKPLGVSSLYLSFGLSSPAFQRQLIKNAKGTAQKGVYLKTLKGLTFPFPSLSEQHRIVDKIEELFSDLDDGIKSLKTAQQKLKVYRQAVLKWAFEGKLTAEWRETQRRLGKLESADTLLAKIKEERERRYREGIDAWRISVKAWELNGKKGKKPRKPTKVKEVPSSDYGAALSKIPDSWLCTSLNQMKEFSLYGPRFSSGDYSDKGVLVLRTSDIDEYGKVDFDKSPKLPLDDTEYEKYKLLKGDLLITRTGSIGTVSVFNDDARAIPGAFLIHYRLLAPINIWYVFHFLKSYKAQKHFKDKSAGVGRPNLNVPSIEELPIPLPSVLEQDKILEELEAKLAICDHLQSEITTNLEKAEALRQGILKHSFEGKLVSQDPNDEPASLLLKRIKREKELSKRSEKLNKSIKKVAVKRKRLVTMTSLLKVLESEDSWLSSQEAFSRCGIADNSSTDAVEKVYLELREILAESVAEVERRGDEDYIRISPKYRGEES